MRRPVRLQPALLAGVVALTAWGCGRGPEPPRRLIEAATVEGRPARSAWLASGGVKRPVLADSASYRVRLPRRGLLTLGLGMADTGEGALRGGMRLTVKADGRPLIRTALSARQPQASCGR